MTISKLLRHHRELKGLTQAEVAAQIKVSREFYVMIENEKKKLPHNKMRKLSEVLGISMKCFIEAAFNDAEAKIKKHFK